MTRLLRLAGCVLVAIVLAGSRAAAEYRQRVALLEQSEPAFVELRARLRGELGAAGFEVISVPLISPDDPKAEAQRVSGALHPAAVVYIVAAQAGTAAESAELWISDRLLRRTFVVRFDATAATSEEAARIAVQAVEILKADLAELSVTRETPAATTPAALPAVASTAPAVAQHEHRSFDLLVEPGVALVQGFSGLGGAWSPILRAGVSVPAREDRSVPVGWQVRAKVSAFGSQARVETSAGSAHIGQSLAGLELVLRLLPKSVLEPLLLASGDAYIVHVEGESAAPTHSGTTYTFATGGGAGLRLAPFRRRAPTLAFELSGLVEVACAPTEIRIAEVRVATAGAPLLLLSTSAVGVF